MEAENFKLNKIYRIIDDQEKQLRIAYKKIEEDSTDREMFLTQRISKLKEWQLRAIKELKFLSKKLKYAVPLTEYEKVCSQFHTYKNKCAELMERCNI